LLDNLLDKLEGPAVLLVGSDGWTDPHINLGALFAQCRCGFGANAVIIPRDPLCQPVTTVRKVAVVRQRLCPLVAVTNLARTLKAVAAARLWIVGNGREKLSS